MTYFKLFVAILLALFGLSSLGAADKIISSDIINYKFMLEFIKDKFNYFDYNPTFHLRDPFVDTTSVSYATANFDKQITRVSVDSLQLVGILFTDRVTNKKTSMAFIRDYSGVIHKVKCGDHIGQNLLRVVNIVLDGVELLRSNNKNSISKLYFK